MDTHTQNIFSTNKFSLCLVSVPETAKLLTLSSSFALLIVELHISGTTAVSLLDWAFYIQHNP